MTHILTRYPAASQASESEFAQAVIEGLSQPQKSLPCRFFYDAAGSALFEEITALPEYYPTRTETAILEDCATAIARATAPGTVLVEFGSGSSRKTEILLRAITGLAAYVPIDVSRAALEDAAGRLATHFPTLASVPVEGDFAQPLPLPDVLAAAPRLGFFPGSTIGNFAPAAATELLRVMARTLGSGSRLVIGVDLRKDPAKLVPAYDDAAGVTARFNRNILVRANRELGADFDLERFAHEAVFNDAESRIEMHLVSKADQTVTIFDRRFAFAREERLHTENSYKYSIENFRTLATRAGWTPVEVWTDSKSLFSVHELHMIAD